jgi:putative lipoprotein
MANRDNLVNFPAHKLVKVKETSQAEVYQEMPNGEIAPSFAPLGSVLGNDVMLGINKQCGFEVKDLKEVRVVSHDEARGLGFEVWVFNDPLSGRDDKITAITVLLKPTPDIGGTDMDFRIPADCHAPKQTTFVFGK